MLPLHVEFDLPLTPAQVLAAMGEEGYQHAKNRSAGAESNTTSVAREGRVLRIRNTRVHSAQLLPAAVRSFAPNPLELVEDQKWEDDGAGGCRGRIRITVPGAPVRVAADLTLAPAGDGSRLVADGQITAEVPLIGSMVERGLEPVVRDGFDNERDALDAWAGQR